jgi:hypothetical protein
MLDLQNKKGSAGTNALAYHRVSADEKKVLTFETSCSAASRSVSSKAVGVGSAAASEPFCSRRYKTFHL